MLKVQQDFQKVLIRLAHGDNVTLAFDGSDIHARFVEDASKLALTTPVYMGGNYIPKGVRKGLSEKLSMGRPTIPTFLTVDEQQFQISLNYLGDAEFITHLQFKDLLEKFNEIAHAWRTVLDEHDRNDRIYVKA